ncbi:glycosylated lysosomal membrane protein [Leucoraja erinacea]|uniref:glycosylated lysosomal membrane protein n=1 Tax=Leucoraja erinaceus TaxID=7782 RepID=UPI0024568066|nr:glycosylated lysosomal membrane protein [Leucoraja erinacea]
MAPVTMLMCCLIALIPGLVRPHDSYRRQVTFEYNPGRNSSAAAPNVLHVRAVGRADTIHYVWSSLGAPTVLLVHTNSPNTSLYINWTSLQLPHPSGALRIEPAAAVRYSTAIVFSRLWEYDDVNDTADLSRAPPDSFYPPYLLQDFTWDDANATLDHNALTAQLRGRNVSAPLFANASVTFRIAAFEGSGRDPELPRLLHSANCSKLEFSIEGLRPRGNFSRFGLELLVLEGAGSERRLRVRSAIDDERYTRPGCVFKVSESCYRSETTPVASPVSFSGNPWLMAPDDRAAATPCRPTTRRCGPRESRQRLPVASIAFAFIGTEPGPRTARLAALNVSFGSPGQRLYREHLYLRGAATGLVLGAGCGGGLMAVGLGLPALGLLVGCLVVNIVRRRRDLTGYRPIN